MQDSNCLGIPALVSLYRLDRVRNRFSNSAIIGKRDVCVNRGTHYLCCSQGD
jgi:hypothetical protein